MVKPALLAVDDDPEVLRAVERDLRSRYGGGYRMLGAANGTVALDVVQKLNLRGEPLALMLVDYRMPQMDGVEFLSQARKIFPETKRVLLTAYADTGAAIRAINDIQLHHYLLKPWDPPELHLYPVLDDLLEDWRSTYRPAFDGVRVLGTRWSPKSYDLRDFLARNQIPYRWFDIESAAPDSEGGKLLASLGSPSPAFPAAVLPDGSCIADATGAQVAAHMGLRTKANAKFYQLIIVGAGPAGLAASVYAASEGVSTLLVEREAPGGQAGLSSRIENYLGFPSGLSGGDLARRAVAQALRFGVELLAPQQASSIRMDGPYRYLQMTDGSEISCHSLMLATGVQWRKLDVPGAERLQGAGIYYGSGITEALACRGETVYVVGGANSAGQAAMNFSRYAERVIMLVRGRGLAATMSRYLIDQIEQTPNISLYTETRVVEAHGDDHLSELTLICEKTGVKETVPATSLFVFIGAAPNTGWLDDTVQRDERGFILTGPSLASASGRPKGWQLDRAPYLFETNIPGIFAVGDARQGSVKRVASGVGEGSVAVQFIHQYLAGL
ncbi:MAG TPA: FAD-dependent oxidoreductase [Bryobacteraceae bacterium]|jgi:thioredoxin reductase (NADPH)|nr:FAD-dependent oxidoreductase [Bryobacteraceae bacterium]